MEQNVQQEVSSAINLTYTLQTPDEIAKFVKYLNDINAKLKHLHVDASYYIDSGHYLVARSTDLAVQYVTGTVKPTKNFPQSSVDRMRFFIKDGADLYRFIKDHKKHINSIEQNDTSLKFTFTHSGKTLVKEFSWTEVDTDNVIASRNRIAMIKNKSTSIGKTRDLIKTEFYDQLVTSTLKEISVINDGTIRVHHSAGTMLKEDEVFRTYFCTNQLFRAVEKSKSNIEVFKYSAEINLVVVSYEDDLFTAISHFCALNTM